MAHPHKRSAARILGLQVHSVLAQFPVVCFTLALLTDIAYWQTANLMWQNFSAWLLFAGLVVGVLAAVAGIVDLFIRRTGTDHRPHWAHAVGSLIVLVLAFFNSLVHAGDGWTAVVPWGLTLSLVTVIVMIITDFYGRLASDRQQVVEVRQVGVNTYE
ncbi:putative membrane protein [Hoeflea marina]|uniref:Putative membrane protein n=1 Tax=Hoeflea marina TaxID=274592 RepID=A0A317PW70_9HYPH|nr:DUF2231 domain-containing protein [Hoeflea marina]PWW04536.1 putative membrane protein [Hoeflea marina]